MKTLNIKTNTASGAMTSLKFSGSSFSLNAGSGYHISWWNPMVFKEANEVGETIEMIYTQTSQYSRTALPPYRDERAVKIIYSCVDGKWNKSEPIYGKIVPAQDEYFEFED